MEVVEFGSEHDEVKDLLEMKKTLKWADDDDKFLERLEFIQKKWLKKLKQAATGKVKTEAKQEAAQPVGRMNEVERPEGGLHGQAKKKRR